MSVLPIREVEKVWGRDSLPAPFEAPAGKRIGEIWFEPPEDLPGLLVKYIFTSEKLSVQVHPGDSGADGDARTGKEECWLILDAEPGASVAIGFREPVDAGTMRAAALDGSIEGLLAWHPARAGDFFYIPAGTVHAIGSGLSLVEIQQNSDVTYRLYDYGRPRELHLDRGIAVARGAPHDPALRHHVGAHGTEELVRAAHFIAHRVEGEPDDALLAEYDTPMLVLPLAGTVRLHGERVWPGECASASSIEALEFEDDAQCVIVRPG